MELRQLHTFSVIAALGSFNKAADVLNLAQSTVSEQIKNLEADLGVQLFRREGRLSVLTSAGDLLLRYARSILDLESELRTEIHGVGAIKGTLSVKLPETVSSCFLPPILREFSRTYPLVELSVHSCSYFGLAEELRSGIINLAFLITESFHSPDLETRELGRVPLVLVTYPENELAKNGPIQLKDLENEPFFAPTSDCDYFRMFDRILAENQVKLATLIRMNSLEGIRQNVREGNGSAILTRVSVEEDLREGRMVELPLESGPFEAKLVMIWHKNRWLTPALEAFIAQFEKSFSMTIASGGTAMSKQ